MDKFASRDLVNRIASFLERHEEHSGFRVTFYFTRMAVVSYIFILNVKLTRIFTVISKIMISCRGEQQYPNGPVHKTAIFLVSFL